MAERVDAAVDGMESCRPHAVGHRAAAHPGRSQLPGGDDAVLARSRFGNQFVGSYLTLTRTMRVKVKYAVAAGVGVG